MKQKDIDADKGRKFTKAVNAKRAAFKKFNAKYKKTKTKKGTKGQ